MNGSGITYEDVILAQSREEEEKLRKKLEAYENMRKEAIELIENVDVSITEYLHGFGYENRKKDLLNILNKVGGNE
jgi:hypothetical protein